MNAFDTQFNIQYKYDRCTFVCELNDLCIAPKCECFSELLECADMHRYVSENVNRCMQTVCRNSTKLMDMNHANHGSIHTNAMGFSIILCQLLNRIIYFCVYLDYVVSCFASNITTDKNQTAGERTNPNGFYQCVTLCVVPSREAPPPHLTKKNDLPGKHKQASGHPQAKPAGRRARGALSRYIGPHSLNQGSPASRLATGGGDVFRSLAPKLDKKIEPGAEELLSIP